MNEPTIDLCGIVKTYGEKAVLTGLDLSVRRDSVLGLLGTNLQGRLAERRIANLIDHAQHAADSIRSRVQRWELTNLTGWSVCLLVIAFYLESLLISGFIDKKMQTIMMYGMTTFIPALGVLVLLGKKAPFLSHELMMPVRRDTYLKQLGMWAAVSQLVMWGAVIASIVLFMFTAAREPRPELLAYGIAFSVLSQIWMFGLVVWFFRFQSILFYMVFPFTAITTIPPLVVLYAPFSPTHWRPLILPIGALLACFGMLLTWRAYRRWLLADFD